MRAFPPQTSLPNRSGQYGARAGVRRLAATARVGPAETLDLLPGTAHSLPVRRGRVLAQPGQMPEDLQHDQSVQPGPQFHAEPEGRGRKARGDRAGAGGERRVAAGVVGLLRDPAEFLGALVTEDGAGEGGPEPARGRRGRTVRRSLVTGHRRPVDQQEPGPVRDRPLPVGEADPHDAWCGRKAVGRTPGVVDRLRQSVVRVGDERGDQVLAAREVVVERLDGRRDLAGYNRSNPASCT